MYFESHAHYDSGQFNEDRYEILESLKNNNVGYVVNVGADIKSSLKSIELSKKYDFVYASVGVHPHEVEKMTDRDLKLLQNYCENEKVVAIGEIGLDFYYDHSPRDIQLKRFREQLEISKIVNKPVIIHSRDACKEVFDIVKESGVKNGVIHAYSGSVEMAKEYINQGFYIGIGGVITFKNAKKLLEVVEQIPTKSILTETDLPYLTPEPFRGTRNISQNLKFIVEKIAQIKQISHQEVEKITCENAKQLFNLK